MNREQAPNSRHNGLTPFTAFGELLICSLAGAGLGICAGLEGAFVGGAIGAVAGAAAAFATHRRAQQSRVASAPRANVVASTTTAA